MTTPEAAAIAANPEDLRCTTLNHALSPCAGCGRRIKGHVHVPAAFGRIFCRRCCPVCQPEASGRKPAATSPASSKKRFNLRGRQLGCLWIDMPTEVHSDVAAQNLNTGSGRGQSTELPMTVKDAARFLGVSAQTVYLWVERRQIPHLRVMGRNIRFLQSDLEPFRAQFKQEVENGTTK